MLFFIRIFEILRFLNHKNSKKFQNLKLYKFQGIFK